MKLPAHQVGVTVNTYSNCSPATARYFFFLYQLITSKLSDRSGVTLHPDISQDSIIPLTLLVIADTTPHILEFSDIANQNSISSRQSLITSTILLHNDRTHILDNCQAHTSLQYVAFGGSWFVLFCMQ